jgi:hypothetical protein
MYRPCVVIHPTRQRTRLRMSWENSELMRALLPPGATAHPRAAQTLLEGLSLWVERPLSVVLTAEDLDSCSALGLCDELGFGNRTAHYTVEVIERARRRGLGRFADLRQLEMQLGGAE